MAKNKQSAELQEVWSLFAQEGKENLALAEEALLKLEPDPDDLEQVKVLFRAVHSFKGGARMMGLGVVESLAHHAEDLIALVRDDGVVMQADMINLLLATLDRLRTMLDQVLSNGQDVAPEQAAGAIDDLKQMIAAKKGAVPVADASPDAPAIDLTVGQVLAMNPEDQAPAPIPAVQHETHACDAVLSEAATADAIADFLRTAETALGRLHSALDAFAAGTEGAPAQIQSVIADLLPPAEQLGYRRLIRVLDELGMVAQTGSKTSLSAEERETCGLQFKKLELALFEELTRIQETNNNPFSKDDEKEKTNWTDIAWLFRRWNAERVSSDLSRLRAIADALDSLVRQVTADMGATRQRDQLIEEIMVRLQAVYHSCIFYHLDPAVHLTLALEDLFARVLHGELAFNTALTQMTRDYTTTLGSAIQVGLAGESPELQPLTKLIEQAEQFLYLHAEGPVQQVARNILDVLDLSADFKPAMTPEALAQFSQALQAKEQFYTLLTDLERNQELGTAFLEWSRSAGIHFITNVTVYRNQRSLFNFLFATSLPKSDLVTSLAKLDPQRQFLTLQECTVRPTADLQTQATEQPMRQAQCVAEPSTYLGSDVSTASLEDLSETLGNMVVVESTLHRVVARLSETDFVEAALRVMQENPGDGTRVRRELQSLQSDWSSGIEMMRRVETDLSSAMEHLQESVRSLRLAPVSQILEPLRRLVQDIGRQQGKLIELKLEGADLQVDRAAIQVLAEPIHQLVWFAATQSVETVEQRRGAGKPAQAYVSVKASASADHIQIVVEDDGRGIDRDVVARRARELGWQNDSDPAGAKLDWVLKPEFGPVGNTEQTTGLNLAALHAALQAHQGRLSLSSDSQHGTHFDVRLPLDRAVVDGMVVRIEAVRYVVPMGSIHRIVKPEAVAWVRSSAEGKQTLVRLDGAIIPVRSLAGHGQADDASNLLIIVEDEQRRMALPIDELIGRQQVLVRPVPGHLAGLPHVSGCALLGEGEVGMVLNLRAI